MNEADFATAIEDMLRLGKWEKWVHFRPARTEQGWRTPLTGDPGFLDYVALRPPRIVVFELKGETGKLTPAESEWLDTWRRCPGAEVYVWWPSDAEEAERVLL